MAVFVIFISLFYVHSFINERVLAWDVYEIGNITTTMIMSAMLSYFIPYTHGSWKIGFVFISFVAISRAINLYYFAFFGAYLYGPEIEFASGMLCGLVVVAQLKWQEYALKKSISLEQFKDDETYFVYVRPSCWPSLLVSSLGVSCSTFYVISGGKWFLARSKKGGFYAQDIGLFRKFFDKFIVIKYEGRVNQDCLDQIVGLKYHKTRRNCVSVYKSINGVSPFPDFNFNCIFPFWWAFMAVRKM